MNQPKAADALKELEPLLGTWSVEMIPPGGEPLEGSSKSVFEWHDSGAHLIQRSTVDIPNVPNSVSIIGTDGANGTYFYLYADDRDVSRIYEMKIGDGEWRLERDGEPFPQRFIGRFEDDDKTIRAAWEKAEDGDFTLDFDLIYRKLD